MVERVTAEDRTAFLLRRDHRVVRALALVGMLVLWKCSRESAGCPRSSCHRPWVCCRIWST
jgi:hypothetical protein